MPTGTKINLTKKFLIEQYINLRKSSLQIAREIGCDKKVILNNLKKHNIEPHRLKGKVYNDLTGKRFDYLLVVKHEKRENRLGHFWRCLCDCGKETVVFQRSLKTGHTKSCGCLKQNSKVGRLKRVGEISGSFWNKVVKSAEKRGYEVGITHREAWRLFQNQNGRCKLSGINLFLSYKFHDRLKITASLDRIDNSKGYVEDNVQWIHKDLNQMKLKFSNDYFIEMCKSVGDFQNSKTQG